MNHLDGGFYAPGGAELESLSLSPWPIVVVCAVVGGVVFLAGLWLGRRRQHRAPELKR